MAPRLRASESTSEYSKRERKAIVLLTLAFIVLSTIAHFALGALYPAFPKPHAAGPAPEQTMIIIYETPTPTPLPPRPTPTPSPVRVVVAPHPVQTGKQASRRRPVVRPPAVIGGGDKPTTSGTDTLGSPGPIAPESPEPSAPPEPLASFAPCRMTRRIQPDYPDWVKSAGIQGTAIVILSMGPDGEVLSARIGDSSGNAALDQAALAAAHASGYQCPPSTGRGGPDLYQVIYTFRLDS